MTELKKSICDKAYDLIFLLDSVTDDEEFVDTVIGCLSCNDTQTLQENEVIGFITNGFL